MNHQKIYNDIILNAKTKNRIKHAGVYYENHHILPKCLNGKNNAENFVLLTAKEHYICHILLTHIYKGNIKLIFALHKMTFDKKLCHSFLSARNYAYAKELLSLNMRGKNHPMFGKKHSVETRQKISNAQIGTKQTKETIEKRIKKCNLKRDETCKKQSQSHKGHIVNEKTRKIISKKLLNKKKTPEHIFHISESHKGLKHSEETKQKISMNSAMKNPEIAKRCGIAHKGFKCSEETKQKMRESAIRRGISKETQAKMLQSRLKNKEEPHGSFFMNI